MAMAQLVSKDYADYDNSVELEVKLSGLTDGRSLHAIITHFEAIRKLAAPYLEAARIKKEAEKAEEKTE